MVAWNYTRMHFKLSIDNISTEYVCTLVKDSYTYVDTRIIRDTYEFLYTSKFNNRLYAYVRVN